jgi:hypothetical protein
MSCRPRTPTDTLSAKEQIFVATFAKTGNVTQSLTAAGYSTISGIGTDILRRPHVKAAIEAARLKVQNKIAYGLERAMTEAEEAIEFARQTDNANAYVKAVELRSKLNGLLVEKVDVRQSGFVLNIAAFGQPAQALPVPEGPPAIDVTPTQEPESDDDAIW